MASRYRNPLHIAAIILYSPATREVGQVGKDSLANREIELLLCAPRGDVPMLVTIFGASVRADVDRSVARGRQMLLNHAPHKPVPAPISRTVLMSLPNHFTKPVTPLARSAICVAPYTRERPVS